MKLGNLLWRTYLHVNLRLFPFKFESVICDHSHGPCGRPSVEAESDQREVERLMQPDATQNEPSPKPSVSESERDLFLPDENDASARGQIRDSSAGALPVHEKFASQRHLVSYQISLHIGLISILALLLIFIAITISYFTIPLFTRAKVFAGEPLSRAPPDYTLDPNWDFSAEPTRREYQWTISDMNLNPDGIFRQMMVINRQFPGPLIECNEGDTIVVHLDNQAANATSIHWHGLFQKGTNHMDGTVGITQCPIAPGQQFTYEFKVEQQSGSYWYHGHYGLQASDGLLGPFIVHSKEEMTLQRIKYTSDRVLMIQDHYHDLSGLLLMRYLRPDQENREPVPDGALLNGHNVRNCDDFLHRDCDNSTNNLPQFDLEPNQRHRIRFINVGTFAEFQIQIDEHEFAVTEVDGTDVLPAYYHRLNIQPGQRYSIIISTDVSTSDSFWLRARMIVYCFSEQNPFLEPEIRAVIRYASKESQFKYPQQLALPSSKDWPEVVEVECKDMNTSELVPVEQITPPGEADAFFYLRSNFEIGAGRLSRGFFNTTSFRPNFRYPLLSRSISGLASGNKSFSIYPAAAALNDAAFDTKREMVIQTSTIQTIDIVIQNFDDGSHPMHLHGYKFFVLATGHGHFNASQVYPNLDLSNPLRRDTVSLESYSWLLIRLITDNPGAWALHCHVSWHAEAGLLMSLLTRSAVLKDWELPSANKRLCEAKGLEKGAGPKDDIWLHDFD